ncbi:MAG: site-2 protease family protein [Candidatus Nanoarchaeia archaeon]
MQNKSGEVTLSSVERDYTLKIEPEQKLGVQIAQHVSIKIKSKLYGMPYRILYLIQFLNWIFILSLGIGLANLIPLGPLDGGRMLLVALTKFLKKARAQWLWSKISALCLILLLLNLLYPYLKNLFRI